MKGKAVLTVLALVISYSCCRNETKECNYSTIYGDFFNHSAPTVLVLELNEEEVSLQREEFYECLPRVIEFEQCNSGPIKDPQCPEPYMSVVYYGIVNDTPLGLHIYDFDYSAPKGLYVWVDYNYELIGRVNLLHEPLDLNENWTLNQEFMSNGYQYLEVFEGLDTVESRNSRIFLNRLNGFIRLEAEYNGEPFILEKQ